MLMAALKFICVFAAIWAAYYWLGLIWKRRYGFEPGYGQIHFVLTRDGWKVALHHYEPDKNRQAVPVLLCHGLGANRFNFDLGAEVSLARYLQKQGFDVWSVDLRGRGLSRQGTKGGVNGRGSHVFDDYVRQDAVAAIRHVQKGAGTARGEVVWLTAVCQFKDQRQGQDREFTTNLSAVVVKQDDSWRFHTMHFSHLGE